jgi:hypothetical protein
MDAKTFSLVAGVIFAVVALLHLVRIFMQWTVVIGDWSGRGHLGRRARPVCWARNAQGACDDKFATRDGPMPA